MTEAEGTVDARRAASLLALTRGDAMAKTKNERNCRRGTFHRAMSKWSVDLTRQGSVA